MITDLNGNIAEKRQFDAWGNIVKLTDGNGNAMAAFVILDRGYTGHEHLFGVALINMNARLYDPVLHRFLSPDNFIQDPFNSQSFNRYGYVMNNPLSRVDKDGNFFFIPIIIGAAILGGGGNVWSHWGEIVKHPWSAIGYFASGAVGGAVTVTPLGPWVGGSITAVGNVATDVAYGNLPKFNGIGSVAKYLGGVALDGVGAADAGQLANFGFNVASQFGWVENVTLNGVSTVTSQGLNTFSVLGQEVSVAATKVPVASLVKAAAGQVGEIAAKGGSEGLKTFGSLTEKFGEGYKTIATAEGKHLPIELGQKLNTTSLGSGSWSKIYEAGILNGSKVEVHYFYNATTGQYVNPFVKMGQWGSKVFRGLK